ncbi:MAG: hypothetical protein ACUVTX_01955 [Bacteroidales bacterium]
MKSLFKLIKYCFLLILIIFLTGTGCASSRKNPWASKRSRASYVNTSRLGKNRYYFSVNYQKKLQKNYKKRR